MSWWQLPASASSLWHVPVFGVHQVCIRKVAVIEGEVVVLEEFLDAWSFGLGTPQVNGLDCFSVLRVEFFETPLEMVEGNGAPITTRHTHQFGVDKFLDNVAQETGHILSF